MAVHALRDIHHSVEAVQLFAPAAAKTATSTSSAVDLQGYEAAEVVINAGAWTDGTFTPSFLDSTDNSTFNAVAAGGLLGSFTVISGTGQQNACYRVGYIGGNRYLKLVLTASGTTTGAFIDAVLIEAGARNETTTAQ